MPGLNKHRRWNPYQEGVGLKTKSRAAPMRCQWLPRQKSLEKSHRRMAVAGNLLGLE